MTESSLNAGATTWAIALMPMLMPMAAAMAADTSDSATTYLCEQYPPPVTTGRDERAVSINRHGKVLLVADPPGFMQDQQTRLVRTDGSYAVIDDMLYPQAVNEKSQVVGSSYEGRAYSWEGGHKQLLPALGGAELWASAMDINPDGTLIVGSSQVKADLSLMRATLWTNGKPTSLGGIKPEYTSYAYAINRHGVVVGMAYPARSKPEVPTMWRDGTISTLEMLPNAVSGRAFGINDAGIVIGNNNDSFLKFFPVAWKDGHLKALAMQPDDTDGGPTAIDNKGRIVGSLYSDSAGGRAVIWYSLDGPPVDLNDRIPGGCKDASGAAQHLRTARAINDRGVIMVSATNSQYRLESFRLTPISH